MVHLQSVGLVSAPPRTVCADHTRRARSRARNEQPQPRQTLREGHSPASDYEADSLPRQPSQSRDRAAPAIRRPQRVASDQARARAHPPLPEERLRKGLNRSASADRRRRNESASASSAGAPRKWTQSVGPSSSHETQGENQRIRRIRRHATPGRAQFPKTRGGPRVSRAGNCQASESPGSPISRAPARALTHTFA